MPVYLDISSFIGFSTGASHYYGKLVGYVRDKYTVVELEYEMTKAQAEAGNIRHAQEYPGDKWHPYRQGSKTMGFDTKENVIEFALKHWKEYFPSENILILGSPCTITPQPILAGAPKRTREQSRRWYEQVRALYGHNTEPSSWKKYDALATKWKKLLERIDTAACRAAKE